MSFSLRGSVWYWFDLSSIVMTKLRRHLDILDDEQASELVERFEKKERRKDC